MLTYLEAHAQIGTSGVSSAPSFAPDALMAVLANSTITNTATATAITGDLGLSPGTSVTNFPPGTVSGTQHINDATAANEQISALAAYNNLQGRSFTSDLTGQNLGSVGTLGPGVYRFSSSAQLTGTLTLNGGPNDVFIFQIGSTLTTASASSVVLTGGAVPGNVFFQVGSSATLGTTTAFQGIIIALASVTMNTLATINGKVIALTGAVTLDHNTIINFSPTAPQSGVVSALQGRGVLSVVRQSVGLFKVTLEDSYARYLSNMTSLRSPPSTATVAITALASGTSYIITTVGDSNWQAAGLGTGIVPKVGMVFTATGVGTGTGIASLIGESGLTCMEVVGDPNQTINIQPNPYLYLQTLGPTGPSDTTIIRKDPADGSIIDLAFLFRNSSLKGKGE